MSKRIARHLARALDELSRARFHATGKPEYKEIDDALDAVSKLFKKSGYEYSSSDSLRIRIRRPEHNA